MCCAYTCCLLKCNLLKSRSVIVNEYAPFFLHTSKGNGRSTTKMNAIKPPLQSGGTYTRNLPSTYSLQSKSCLVSLISWSSIDHSQILDVNSEKRRDLVIRSNSEVCLHKFPFTEPLLLQIREHYNCHHHATQADPEASDDHVWLFKVYTVVRLYSHYTCFRRLLGQTGSGKSTVRAICMRLTWQLMSLKLCS